MCLCFSAKFTGPWLPPRSIEREVIRNRVFRPRIHTYVSSIWGTEEISIPASQGRMPVSCSFLLSADSGLPARAHLFTEMRPQEVYHVGVQILGFYLNVFHQLMCIQLPRWQPPCSHRATWESGLTEREIIWKIHRVKVSPQKSMKNRQENLPLA